MTDPQVKFPEILDLRRAAKRRIPHFAWEYLDSAEGRERAMDRNNADLQRVVMTPQFLKGQLDPDLSTTLFGVDYSMPVGMSPVGMSGLMWPGADEILEHLESFIDLEDCLTSSAPLGTLGDYTLRRQIGRGGMGVVYEAWQGSMERRVALKVLPLGVAADDKAFHRFMDFTLRDNAPTPP